MEKIKINQISKKLVLNLREEINQGNYPFYCIAVHEFTKKEFYQCNEVNQKGNLLEHAEIVLIRKLLNEYDNLSEFIFFCSSFPCLMCLGALIHSGVREIWYGVPLEDTISLGLDCIDFELKNIHTVGLLKIYQFPNYDNFKELLDFWKRKNQIYLWLKRGKIDAEGK